MTPGPLVSILTPSFNQAEWLEKNVSSVQSQSYEPIEHIVMDGGSTDGTKQFLEGSPPSVVWRSERDRGQSDAINKAFAESRGEIIGWLNSDDAYFDPRTVEWAVEAFERHPTADVVYGHAAVVNAGGELLHLRWVPRFSQRLLLVDNFLVQPAVFIRRSTIEGDKLVDDSYDNTMDRALWLRLGSEGRRFLRLDRVVAIDRRYPERKSAMLGQIWADRRRVDAMYGAPTGGWTRTARWLLHIISRVNGLRLVRQALGPENLIDIKPRFSELMMRQIARRRRNMPV